MKTLIAFYKKEWMELVRSGRLMIMGILSVLFGIMSPAMAKLTPWLMETLSEDLEASGFTVTDITVDALSSWTQFYKNVPMLLIAFVLLFSGILVTELQKGTLIPIASKGYAKWKIVIAKFLILVTVWTLGYFLCYGITYFYTCYFWDISITSHNFVAAAFYWSFGIMIISLMMLFSTLSKGSGTVLLGCGGCVAIMYMLEFISKIKDYLPLKLMDGLSLLTSVCDVSDYLGALFIVGIICIISWILAIVRFNKVIL